jgi:two-component system, NarL family, sensor kinase
MAVPPAGVATVPDHDPEAPGRNPIVPRLYRAARQRQELVAFLVTALLALFAVSAGAIWLSERIARSNALDDAQRAARQMAEDVVAPVLRDALGDRPDRWEELRRDVGNQLGNGSITSVRVWAEDGEVLFDSTGRSNGARPPELAAAIEEGVVVADVDHRVPGRPDAESTAVLEVFVPLTIEGQSLAVQSFSSYAGIDEQAARLRREMIPLAVGALVVLQLIQIPIATSLARRVRRQQAERAQLLAHTVEASERERRVIASDVHDGPVQDLAGVSYALTALRASVPAERQPTVDRLVGAVRNAVQSLRRLMIDIYPPDLSGPGLAGAISDCADALRTADVEVSMDAGPLPELGPETAAVLYRTAKEALVNVGKHAGAGRVWITLEEAVTGGGTAVRLEIADDGVGFPATGTDRRVEGHFGLSFLAERLEGIGGTVELGDRLGGGAVLTATVPTRRG